MGIGGGIGRSSFRSIVDSAATPSSTSTAFVPLVFSSPKSAGSKIPSTRSKSSSTRSSKETGQAIIVVAIIAVTLTIFIIGFLAAYGLVRWADKRYEEYRRIEETLEASV